MSDLIINNNGDLNIIQVTETVSDERRTVPAAFDLEITNNTLEAAIKRAIQTPLGHLEQASLIEGNINFIDSNYGSLIYNELSEGITLNLLSRIKGHITNSLRVAGYLVNIADLRLSAVDTYTIQLYITYTDNTAATNITLEI